MEAGPNCTCIYESCSCLRTFNECFGNKRSLPRSRCERSLWGGSHRSFKIKSGFFLSIWIDIVSIFHDEYAFYNCDFSTSVHVSKPEDPEERLVTLLDSLITPVAHV